MAAAPPPPAQQITPQVYATAQRRLQDRFSFYRQGLPWDDSPARQAVYQNLNVPNVASNPIEMVHPGPTSPVPRLRAQTLANLRRLKFRGAVHVDPQDQRHTKEELARAIYQLQQLPQPPQPGASVRYCKAIGWGGCALATLWEITGGNGQKRLIVAKHALNQNKRNALRREKLRLVELARAAHILQRFDVTRYLAGPAAPNPAPQYPDNSNDILVLEHARFGDLDRLARRVSMANLAPKRRGALPEDRFPTQVLWHIFHCLATSCIAMEYPPRFQPDTPRVTVNGSRLTITGHGRQRHERPEQGDPLDEVIPQNGNAYHLVHFDLDPTNIFVHDTDQNHPIIPIIKLGDFGLARLPWESQALQRNPNNLLQTLDEGYGMWSCRAVGKVDWFTPEQFTARWDRVNLYSDPITDGHYPHPGMMPPNRNWSRIGIPGNWGSWSNVWQVGQVMWCLMTLNEPNRPPVPDTIPNSPQGMLSYGHELLDPALPFVGWYGVPLCRLVAECMAHSPSHRPDLAQIMNTINANITPIPAGNMPWVHRYFRDPPRPPRARFFAFPAGMQPVPGQPVPFVPVDPFRSKGNRF